MIARIMIDDGGEKSIANVSSALGTARCQAGPQKILGQTFTHTCEICRRRFLFGSRRTCREQKLDLGCGSKGLPEAEGASALKGRKMRPPDESRT
jgi:hypothetical protein